MIDIMYDKTITVFNYYESPISGEAVWYPHVLHGVDLNTDRGAIMKKYGADSTDNAILHIAYYQHATDPEDDRILIADSSGMIPWVPPKKWKGQTNDTLAESVTFGSDSFFWQGEWDGGVVNDADYREGFYQYMNSSRDFVFKITSVGGPYTVIPHFEILGK